MTGRKGQCPGNLAVVEMGVMEGVRLCESSFRFLRSQVNGENLGGASIFEVFGEDHQ